MLKSLPRIARQWSLEKIAVLSVKPPSNVRILTYRTWAIRQGKNPLAPMVLCTMPQFDEEDKKREMNFNLIGLILK